MVILSAKAGVNALSWTNSLDQVLHHHLYSLSNPEKDAVMTGKFIFVPRIPSCGEVGFRGMNLTMLAGGNYFGLLGHEMVGRFDMRPREELRGSDGFQWEEEKITFYNDDSKIHEEILCRGVANYLAKMNESIFNQNEPLTREKIFERFLDVLPQ